MDCRILGPLEVWDRGEMLALGGTKQRAVLADLLIHANEVVSTDRLIDDLWGEEPPETAQSAVQGYVSHLRKLLGRGSHQGGSRSRATGVSLMPQPGGRSIPLFGRLETE